ncbi:MAG TPA: response regulator [bacterium]|nr:response regulator [bacterium]
MGSYAASDAFEKRLLLVDDDEDFCRLISKRLSGEGYDVAWSTKAQGVEDLIRKVRPAAVLLDLQLRDAEGLTVLEGIRKNDPALPVIILTGYETVATAVKAMKSGAFHYLSKPVDVPELKNLLEAAIQTQDAAPNRPSLVNASVKAKEAVERQLILETLDKTHWHQGKAASLLGVDPKTLYNKMKGYGIRGRSG